MHHAGPPLGYPARRLETGKGDAVIASMASSEALARRSSIFRSPTTGRRPASSCAGTGRLSADARRVDGEDRRSRRRDAHEVYLKLFFPTALPKPFASLADLEVRSEVERDRRGVRGRRDVGDLAQRRKTVPTAANSGEGRISRAGSSEKASGIAVRKDDDELRKAFNWALAAIMRDGVYAEIYLKYFPISFY